MPHIDGPSSQSTDSGLDIISATDLSGASENDKIISKMIKGNPRLKIRNDVTWKSNALYVNIAHSPHIKEQTYYHYHVASRYWLNVDDLNSISMARYRKLTLNMPYSFKVVNEECCRISEQGSPDLYRELLTLELYLRSRWCKMTNSSVDNIFNRLKSTWR